MPVPTQDFIVVPETSPVRVELEPAQNAFYSLVSLVKSEQISGLGEWVGRTVESLSPELRQRHKLVMIGFFHAIQPERSWPSFPAYVDHLAAADPQDLVKRMLKTYAMISMACEGECTGSVAETDWQEVLKDVDSYLSFLRDRFGPEAMEPDLEAHAYRYLVDPPAMLELVVSHLREMWRDHLAAEWGRVEPMLRDSVTAFRQLGLGKMTKLEAARLITGQDLEDEKWGLAFEKAEQLVFVPSAHIGPYVGRLWTPETLWVVFGARLPEGVAFHAPDLSRADIVVRLSALADDSRLRVMRLIAEAGELRSQDIIDRLGLSQSAASRHLTQLTATGYLTERRCNGAKCYSLNRPRLESTLRSVEAYLLGQ